MNTLYIKALETKADWLDWAMKNDFAQGDHGVESLAKVSLVSDNTYIMNSKFAELVDHARMTLPDEAVWDNTWVQSPTGFLWVENEFSLPNFLLDFSTPTMQRARERATPEELEKLKFAAVKIAAVGWAPVDRVRQLDDGRMFGQLSNFKTMTDGTAFICFFANKFDKGFSPWAHFTVKSGDNVLDKIKVFEKFAEKAGGAYAQDNTTKLKHEVRWLYTAFHLMAQKLSITLDMDTDRATRRRAERSAKVVPAKFRVISLRRMEMARAASSNPVDVEWQWRWTVRGHWRNQWCSSTKTHKQVFIEAYIKGPEDKPLKDPAQNLFSAVR